MGPRTDRSRDEQQLNVHSATHFKKCKFNNDRCSKSPDSLGFEERARVFDAFGEVSVSRLRQALRTERARGSSGHPSYDLERHLELAHRLKSATKRA